MKPIRAIHYAPITKSVNGQFVRGHDPRAVVIMAEVGLYAMVRRKGAVPYVAMRRDLARVEAKEIR